MYSGALLRKYCRKSLTVPSRIYLRFFIRKIADLGLMRQKNKVLCFNNNDKIQENNKVSIKIMMNSANKLRVKAI